MIHSEDGSSGCLKPCYFMGFDIEVLLSHIDSRVREPHFLAATQDPLGSLPWGTAVEPTMEPIHVDHGISPPMGPVIPESCDALASHLPQVSQQITHQALGHQHQPILAQACMAPAPLL